MDYEENEIAEEETISNGQEKGSIRLPVTCYDKSYKNSVGLILRDNVGAAMKDTFRKIKEKESIKIVRQLMPYYMVAFHALWGESFIWTGHNTSDGIPELKKVH
jgi:hypothetical protein